MNKKEKEIASKDISPNPNDQSMTKEQYWKKNISCVLILLAVWFIVSYGCGILFVETLNEIKIGGAGFGFDLKVAKISGVIALIGSFILTILFYLAGRNFF